LVRVPRLVPPPRKAGHCPERVMRCQRACAQSRWRRGPESAKLDRSAVLTGCCVLSAARLPAVCSVGPGVCAASSDIIFQDGFE